MVSAKDALASFCQWGSVSGHRGSGCGSKLVDKQRAALNTRLLSVHKWIHNNINRSPLQITHVVIYYFGLKFPEMTTFNDQQQQQEGEVQSAVKEVCDDRDSLLLLPTWTVLLLLLRIYLLLPIIKSYCIINTFGVLFLVSVVAALLLVR